MMPNDPKESSFMLAAAKNIADLQIQVSTAQQAADSAKESADAANKDANRWKKLTIGVIVVVLVALAASGLSIYNWVQAKDATDQLRAQAVAACVQGNVARNAEITVWDSFITLLIKGDTKPSDLAAAKAFEHFIAQNLGPRDCSKAYSSARAAK